MKKVLILGSSGYIGSFLVNGLKKKYKVIAHSRKKIVNRDFNKGIYKKIYGDIRNRSTLEKIIKLKPDIIIFTISLNHFVSEKNLNTSIKNNYNTLKNLTNLLIKKKIYSKIIYFSTMQVYGREYKKKIIDEKYKKKINNIYSLTHSMCEDLLLKLNGRLKSHSLRLSNSYGMPVLKNINCWWLVLNDLCRSAKKNGKITIKSDGTALRDFIALEDILKIVDKLIIKNISAPILNVCSGKTFSIKEIAIKISKNPYFTKKIPIEILKKKNNVKIKKFQYDTKIIKKIGLKSFVNIDIQIKKFLNEI